MGDNVLTKAEITKVLVDKLGFNKKESKSMVDQFYSEIVNVLEKGESVRISSFGNFMLRDKSSRPGLNLTTGKPVSISARRVVTFKAGQKLRSVIDNANI